MTQVNTCKSASTAAWAFLHQVTDYKCFFERQYFHSPKSGIKREQDSLTKKKKFCDISVKPLFTDKLLATPVFEGPQLSDKVVKYPVTFPVISVCHCGLSALIGMQFKHWNKLNVRPYQTLKLASFQTFNLWQLHLAPAISLMTQYNTSATILVADRIYVWLMFYHFSNM